MTRVAVETKTLGNLFCMENFPEKSEKKITPLNELIMPPKELPKVEIFEALC